MKALNIRTGAYAILGISAIALTFFGLTFAADTSERVRGALGISASSRPMATASKQCVPQSDLSDVYFVSCGGFF